VGVRATTAELVRAASTDAADDAARASEGGGGLEGDASDGGRRRALDRALAALRDHFGRECEPPAVLDVLEAAAAAAAAVSENIGEHVARRLTRSPAEARNVSADAAASDAWPACAAVAPWCSGATAAAAAAPEAHGGGPRGAAATTLLRDLASEERARRRRVVAPLSLAAGELHATEASGGGVVRLCFDLMKRSDEK